MAALIASVIESRKSLGPEVRENWTAYAATLRPDMVQVTRGRGVIIIGGRNHHNATNFQVPGRDYVSQDAGFTEEAMLAIAALHHVGSRLPIELWHDHDPLLLGESGEVAHAALNSIADVTLVDFYDFPEGQSVTGFETLSFAIRYSNFSEVLFIDSDNALLADPSPLFDLPEYAETGALFWRDQIFSREMTIEGNYLWQVIGVEERPQHDMESGQMLINRRKHWKPVLLVDYFNRYPDHWFWTFSWGDKDLWQWAWLALNASFYLSPRHFEYMYDEDEKSHSHTQLHPSDGAALFWHRALLKWRHIRNDQKSRCFYASPVIADGRVASLPQESQRPRTVAAVREIEALFNELHVRLEENASLPCLDWWKVWAEYLHSREPPRLQPTSPGG